MQFTFLSTTIYIYIEDNLDSKSIIVQSITKILKQFTPLTPIAFCNDEPLQIPSIRIKRISFRSKMLELTLVLCVCALIPGEAANNEARNCLNDLIALLFPPDDDVVFIDAPSISGVDCKQPRVTLDAAGTAITATGAKFATNFVMFVDDHQQFARAFAVLLKSTLWSHHYSPRGHFLVVSELDLAFSELWQRGVHKILLYKLDSGQVLTANPFASAGHNSPFVLVLGHCADLANVKFADFAYLADRWPFTFYRAFRYEPYYGDAYLDSVGLADVVVDTIAKQFRFNFTHVFYANFSYAYEHALYNHSNGTNSSLQAGVFDMFELVDAYDEHYWDGYDITESAFTDGQIFVFKKPGPKTNVEVMISIFRPECWMLILLLLLSTTTMIYLLIRAPEDPVVILLLVLATTLNMASTSARRSINNKFVKALTLIYVIYAVHISMFFQGRFASLITHPPLQKDIRTLDDLVHSNIIPTFSVRKHRLITNGNDSSPLIAKLLRRAEIINLLTNRIEFVVNNPKYAAVAYRSNYYLSGNDRQVKTVDSFSVVANEIRFGLRRGHPFTDRMNRIIGSIVSAGLTQKWLSDLKGSGFNGSWNGDPEASRVVLTFDHLLAGFVIFVAGTVLAIAAFICELIFHKIPQFSGTFTALTGTNL